MSQGIKNGLVSGRFMLLACSPDCSQEGTKPWHATLAAAASGMTLHDPSSMHAPEHLQPHGTAQDGEGPPHLMAGPCLRSLHQQLKRGEVVVACQQELHHLQQHPKSRVG